ncbi:UNVERIFIED_CONTAM: hypothetical protein Sangu_2937100 [Sesamum angustifolium]|uniref:Uncharacterized protein n=1 Tax=Sesamum angustifolium TaxID=2727405 RepID=A0AAW2IK40_9LAMI
MGERLSAEDLSKPLLEDDSGSFAFGEAKRGTLTQVTVAPHHLLDESLEKDEPGVFHFTPRHEVRF